MPLALLLQSAFAPLADASRVLDTWNAVLRLEALVIDRGRGAFLVTWFGSGLPRANGRLAVVIDNIAALGEQYRLARAQTHGGQTGPSLTEPLAGMAGMAAGMFLSPSGVLMYLWATVRESLGLIGASLVTLIWGPLMIGIFTGIGGAVAVVILPFALLLGLGMGIAATAGWETGPAAIDLMRDIARGMQALTRFVNLLTGPREAIRNPLLRSLLLLFDRVAALLAQLIGAVAFLVTRIGPLILSNARQWQLLLALGEAAMELSRRIVVDALATLLRLVQDEDGEAASPWTVLKRMLSFVTTMAERLIEGTGVALTTLAGSLTAGMELIGGVTRLGLLAVVAAAGVAVTGMPLFRTFRAAAAMATAVRAILPASAPAAPATPSKPGMLGTVAALVLPPRPTVPTLIPPAAIAYFLGPPPPTPGVTGARSLIDALRSGRPLPAPSGLWGGSLTSAMVAPFELSPATRAMANELMRRPASVFEGERAAIRAELGSRTPQEALAAMRTEDLRYRNLLSAVVSNVLPAQARNYMPRLLGMFETLDRLLYHHDAPAVAANGGAEFPVRSLPDNGRLRPIVHQVTVRSASGDEFSTREFAHEVVTRMRGMTFLATGTGTGTVPETAPATSE